MISKLTAITPEYMKHRIEEETEQYKQEIERLHSIIKEVREYIEVLNEYGIGKTAKKELLEILDKENK